MDVTAWLKNLGLGQYDTAFRDNAIDADVLPSLTPEDLKDLGVTIVGHRRKLLDAIAALSASRLAPNSAPPVLKKSTDFAAERRPITVMFCDLVGSTGLAAKLDPEDWRNLVGSYLDAASAAVTSLGGHVQQKLGDGLMALFGYPQAQENDGERAVRAAIAIQRALAELNARNAETGAPELAARIGLDSGRVVVDSTGESIRRRAQRRCAGPGTAAPGSVFVTPPCTVRSWACSSPRTAARMRSKACRRRSHSTAWSVRTEGGASAPAPSLRSSGARRSSISSAGGGSAW